METIFAAHKCKNGCRCDFVNAGLERHIASFTSLGAVPHCFFAELARHTILFADKNNEEMSLYASAAAFYENHDRETMHAHSSLEHLFRHEPNTRVLTLYAAGGFKVALSMEETRKLMEQIHNQTSRDDALCSEDMELDGGQAMIFSTPDPELSDDFINYLSAVFTPVNQVESVYAFETSNEQGTEATLVIGIVPTVKLSRNEADRLSLFIIGGVEQYLGDREIVDFMILDEPELVKIAASVSPEIKLCRQGS